MLLLNPAPPGTIFPPTGVTIEFDAETGRSYWEMHNTSHESLVELGPECYCCKFCQWSVCNPNHPQECFGGCQI